MAVNQIAQLDEYYRYFQKIPSEAEALIASRFERQERISFRIRVEAIYDHLD